MNLTKGEKINAPVLVSGALSQMRYEVMVKDVMHEGDLFNVYLGEDARGAYVCLKTLRYCSESKDAFGSTKDYILYRRSLLAAEHRLLGISHPCLPAPLVMFSMENNALEDHRLFHNIAEWDSLRLREPVLVLEYFTGYPLPCLTDKLRVFSLKRRLNIVVKVAKLCQFIEEQGYIVQSLHPSNIILKPSHDDNVYLIGLHNACIQPNGKVDRQHPGFSHFTRGYAPLESCENGHNYDQRVDIFELGMLLYYLITLCDPAKEGLKGKSFLGKKERARLEKGIRSLDGSALWLGDLVSRMLEPLPELRIPDIITLLNYLESPPKEFVSFKIQKVSREQTELKVLRVPGWSTHLKVRLETSGYMIAKECPNTKIIKLPGVGSGTVVCAVAATDGRQVSWWQYEQKTVSPEIRFYPMKNLPPHRFGFEWDCPAELHHVAIRVANSKETVDLGEFTGSSVELPPKEVSLPYYEDLQVECTSHFQFPSGIVKGNVFFHPVRLYPPIPAPLFQEVDRNLHVEMMVSPKQAALYVEIEVLRNGWPWEADRKTTETISGQKRIIFFFSRDRFNFFDEQELSFRVLIEDLGWRTGPSVPLLVSPPPVTNVQIVERQMGWVEVLWDPSHHPQIESYEIYCEGNPVGRSRTTSYSMRLPLKPVLQENKQELAIAVCAVYRGKDAEKLSLPTTAKFEIGEWRSSLRYKCEQQVTPFFVSFHLWIENCSALESLSSVLIFRRRNVKEEENETLARLDLKPEITVRDEEVAEGESYEYSVVLEETDLYLMEQRVEVPSVDIRGGVQEMRYENCLLEIHIAPATAACVSGEIEIVRHGQPQKSHCLKWPKGEEYYYLEDKDLLPGQTYRYILNVPLCDQSIYSLDLGEVNTPTFHIEEKIEVGYNYALITWTPNPTGHIEAIEVYDSDQRLIGATESDSITLENLEPERKYEFPLKYRYLSGKVVDGQLLSFTTLPYTVPWEVVDVDSTSFRLRWRIPDRRIKGKIVEFSLEVSEGVGNHKLGGKTRSVQMRNLCPSTLYRWELRAYFNSGTSSILATGEATTQTPGFTVEVEVGLVHHIKWDFPYSEGIQKIEVHRDDTFLIETTENEVYDSDFKTGQEVTYKFYYVMRNERRLPAGEKKVNALSLSDLYATLKIEAGIGLIRWDFTDLKQFKYLKYVELSRNGIMVYKQGSHLSTLTFDDKGDSVKESGEPLGLPGESINFQIAVVGVAPIVRKCKKKWLLNIKGIQCNYPKFPAEFRVIREYSCIYFEWDYTPTDLLEEIALWRAADGLTLYRGPNEPCLVYDDNEEQGLEPDPAYLYCMKMVYKNHEPPPENCNDYYEELEKPFNPAMLKSRLGITSRIADNVLEIKWNSQLMTSISHIRCRISHGVLGRFSVLSKFLGHSKWTEFPEGMLTVPLPSSPHFQYQLFFQDYYGKQFCSPPEDSENLFCEE